MFYNPFKSGKKPSKASIESERVALAIKPKTERDANRRWNGGTIYNGNVAAIR